jgi:anthranilate synthase component 1
VLEKLPDGQEKSYEVSAEQPLMDCLQRFGTAFQSSPDTFKFSTNGLFGYTQYDTVGWFEDIHLKASPSEEVPMMHYAMYQNIIVVDHYKNELHLFEHLVEGAERASYLDEIETLLNNKNIPAYSFKKVGEEVSNYSDAEFLGLLGQAQKHCQRGDVFQLVLSRRFTTAFKGDEFNVYRALRSVNPSPYLFYFDYGSFKVFGSSPEAQIVVKNQKATLFPIAGTFRRTGNDVEDAALARKLYDDPKENAEHVMLVDLARNDLSRVCTDVRVKQYRQVHYYSHVIHLVSEVEGKVAEGSNPFHLIAKTFPAGTLSGAPKFKAMQIIDAIEPTKRSYYGGCIGFVGFNGTCNQAIMIRTFLSQQNTLTYQAGAGVVAASVPENELQEVNNKLNALKTAMVLAEKIHN